LLLQPNVPGSFNLSNLRPEESSQQNLSSKSPQDIEQIKLGELRGEIVLATNQRDSLLKEIEQLNQSLELTKDRLKSDTEVKRLKIQKTILLKQVAEITRVFGILKDKKESFVKGLDAFGEERINFLASLSRAMSLDIQDEAKKLQQRVVVVAKEEDFWAGFAEYYTQLAEITEATASLQARQEADLKQGYIDVGEKGKLAEKMAGTAGRWLVLAEDKLKVAKKRLKDAETKASSLEESISSQQAGLLKQTGALARIKKSLDSDRLYLKKQADKLDQKEKWLEDREQTLGRAYKEIISRGGII